MRDAFLFFFFVDVNDLLLKERLDVLKTSDVTADFVDDLPGNRPCVFIAPINQPILPIMKRIQNLTRISPIAKSGIYNLKSINEKNHYFLVFHEVTFIFLFIEKFYFN